MRRTTLKDVGDRVGVSAKTVSNVVNGTGWVSEDLAERVRAALLELDYRPNNAARLLRGGRSGMIALALPDLRQSYFAELAAAFVDEAAKRSTTVLINQTNALADAERRISDGVGLPILDGLILSPLALGASELEKRVDSTPMVLLGEHADATALPHVGVDNAAAARAATEYLLASGRTRIAAIGAQAAGPNETSKLRMAGYRQALKAAKVPWRPELVQRVGDFRRADGAEAIRRLLEAGTEFDAVFAFNDLMALGALHALSESGKRVPDEVAVVGFDDIEEGRYSTPSLTTVAPDKSAIAALALDLLLGAPEPNTPVKHSQVPFRITKRESA
ncbi:LacI family DNA-binding transcriptional regulator [Gryllotalpicola koreensis]|uniref:LacI family DNA-binding transcriptional regulator n=1 Tax=Gryllotalpicola koreensis TaxID=993086 RepID=A0ABP8A0G7_9MICO